MVRGQGRDIKAAVSLAGCHQAQTFADVVVFGPAHPAFGISHAPALVIVIVAARAVGSGNYDIQFLFHEFAIRETGSGQTDQTYSGPVPGDCSGGLKRLVGLGCRGDKDAVATPAPGNHGNRLL